MYSETLRTYQTKHFTVELEVIDFCEGCSWLQDLYKGTDVHQGGVTVQVPDFLQTRHGYKYYVGQYTPAQLASDFAKQGIENPSQQAYKSLQKQLAHYIQASDCAIKVTISKCDIELASAYSCGFDWSCELDEPLEGYALLMLKEYGRDFIKECIKEARTTLESLAA